MPRSASAATRSFSSALMVAASALPSRMCAVMVLRSVLQVCRSVVEVAGTGEVHRPAGRLDGLDHPLVAERAAPLHDGADPRLEQELRAVVEGEEGIRRGD